MARPECASSVNPALPRVSSPIVQEKIFLAEEKFPFLAGFFWKNSPHGVKWRGKNLFPGPGDSSPLPAPPRNTPKNEPPEKKRRGLPYPLDQLLRH